MNKPRFAEQANYWQTTVHSAVSQGKITQLLEDFGSTNLTVTTGRVQHRLAWLIRFEYMGATYRFTFTPLMCEFPVTTKSFGGQRRTHAKQAEYQMGRIALHFVKAILTAAETQPVALFAFQELPGVGTHPGGLPFTAGELNTSGLTEALPDLVTGSVLMLEAESVEVLEGVIE